MLWFVFILLFVFEANGFIVPWIAWVLAWVYAVISVLDIVIKSLDKKDKDK